jgi:hypothetical protein
MLTADNAQRNKIDFVYRFLQHQFSKSPVHESQQTLVVIKGITQNCLEEFVRSILDLQYRGEYEDNANGSLITSCINSFCSLSSLFIGIKKTKEMMHSINIKPCFELTFTLPSQKLFSFKIIDLFAGNATHIINHDPDYLDSGEKVQHEKLSQILDPYLSHFHNRVQQHVIDRFTAKWVEDKAVSKAMITYIKNSGFKFNASVIESLRNSMTATALKVTKSVSFLYCVNAKIPIFSYEGFSSLVEHAFLLEQYFSPTQQAPRVRIYQSWIDIASVTDDMAKRQFDVKDKGSWNEKQTEKFLDNLHDYYCSNTGYLEPEKAFACFGYEEYRQARLPLVISYSNFISGISLRYISHEFNPAQTLDRLRDIILQIK